MSGEVLGDTWEYLDHIHGVGFTVEVDVRADGHAMVSLHERGVPRSWICTPLTRQEAYEWIGKKIEETIVGRPEMVRMEDREQSRARVE